MKGSDKKTLTSKISLQKIEFSFLSLDLVREWKVHSGDSLMHSLINSFYLVVIYDPSTLFRCLGSSNEQNSHKFLPTRSLQSPTLGNLNVISNSFCIRTLLVLSDLCPHPPTSLSFYPRAMLNQIPDVISFICKYFIIYLKRYRFLHRNLNYYI